MNTIQINASNAKEIGNLLGVKRTVTVDDLANAGAAFTAKMEAQEGTRDPFPYPIRKEAK